MPINAVLIYLVHALVQGHGPLFIIWFEPSVVPFLNPRGPMCYRKQIILIVALEIVLIPYKMYVQYSIYNPYIYTRAAGLRGSLTRNDDRTRPLSGSGMAEARHEGKTVELTTWEVDTTEILDVQLCATAKSLTT